MSRPSDSAGSGDPTDSVDTVGGPVLSVERLGVTSSRYSLVENVSLQIGAGERVGLIGESGSGKTLTALAILGLLPETLRASGSVRLRGADVDLVGASEHELADIRGRRGCGRSRRPRARPGGCARACSHPSGPDR